MDFISKHPALQRNSVQGRQFAAVYQQLGVAWDLLAMQCKHRGGWRRASNGKLACKIRGSEEPWLLLPRNGRKSIGRRAMPISRRTFPSRKEATLVNDTIHFHGARLTVEVLNQHQSNFQGFRKHNWTIAADRLVNLKESGVEVRFSSGLITVQLRKHIRGEMPPYSHFVGELPRKFLKEFPVMLQFDKRNRFTGMVVFKPDSSKREGDKSRRLR